MILLFLCEAYRIAYGNCVAFSVELKYTCSITYRNIYKLSWYMYIIDKTCVFVNGLTTQN